MLKRIICFVLTLAFVSLAACTSEKGNEISKASSDTAETTAIDGTTSTYDTEKTNSSVSEKENVTKAPVSEKAASDTAKSQESTARTEKSTAAVTKMNKTEVTKVNVPSETKNNVTVPEKSQGMSILSKTSPVARGKQASITIMGTPNKEFTASFCTKGLKNEIKLSEQIKTDSVGIATLVFTVPSSCELGNNMLTVKETGTSNYLQTCITVF